MGTQSRSQISAGARRSTTVQKRKRERELGVLQRQQNKGVKSWESGGRGTVHSALLKLQVKHKVLHSAKVPVSAKEWLLRPLPREKQRYIKWEVDWQLKLLKQDYAAQTASETQGTSQCKSTRECERMAAETPAKREATLHRMRGRLAAESPEITADEHQPERKVGSWSPRGERNEVTVDERWTGSWKKQDYSRWVRTLHLMKGGFRPNSSQQYLQSCDLMCVSSITHLVCYHSLRLAPRCHASTLVLQCCMPRWQQTCWYACRYVLWLYLKSIYREKLCTSDLV